MFRRFQLDGVRVWGLALVASLWACGVGSDAGGAHCISVPCPEPWAVRLTVTSAAGGPVPGATIAVTGAMLGGGPCNVGADATMCDVPGGPGTYAMTVTAPGYQTASITVKVPGQTATGCGCTTAQTQDTSLVLTPQA